jgi:hypothetical protein
LVWLLTFSKEKVAKKPNQTHPKLFITVHMCNDASEALATKAPNSTRGV